MLNFFASLRGNLHRSTDEIGEITRMLEAMYKRFTVEHGLKLTPPNSFSTLRYEKEIDRLEKAFNSQFNTVLNIVTTEKHALTQKFFETIAVQARRTFEVANRDVENWLRAVMSPLETQVREYQLQLKRRLESVKRIHQATDTLEERIVELQQSEQGVLHELEELTRPPTRSTWNSTGTLPTRITCSRRGPPEQRRRHPRHALKKMDPREGPFMFVQTRQEREANPASQALPPVS